MIGAAVGGLAGAIWADRNNDGMVDGYVYNGQYYAGAPVGCRRSGSGSDLHGADPQWRTRLIGPVKATLTEPDWRTSDKFA